MDKQEILSIYDDWYAETYDERFHGGDIWNDNLGAYKIELVGELLSDDGRWLDTGCGTGKHLAAYPEVDRCGLDLSASMLARAAESNPGVPFVHGSYLDDHPEWSGSWDLVTNLWLSYQFVDSIKAVHDVVANLSSWVAPTGALMMHVADCEDVARGVQLPWEDPETPVFSDSLYITAVLWSWKEANGREHKDLVAPQLQRMVNMVAEFFEEVEVRRWPSTFPGSDRPKAVIGRRKRAVPLTADEVGRTYPFEETFPPPDHPMEHGHGPAVEAEAEGIEDAGDDVAAGSSEELDAAAATGGSEPDADVRDPGPADAPPAPGDLVASLPTGALLKEVAKRSRPSDPRVWSTLGRQVTGVVRRRRPQGSADR